MGAMYTRLIDIFRIHLLALNRGLQVTGNRRLNQKEEVKIWINRLLGHQKDWLAIFLCFVGEITYLPLDSINKDD